MTRLPDGYRYSLQFTNEPDPKLIEVQVDYVGDGTPESLRPEHIRSLPIESVLESVRQSWAEYFRSEAS